MKHKFTHTGFIVGCDNRISENYRKKIKLRETEKFWISEYGVKYRKTSLRGIGDWPLYRLEEGSIHKIEEP